MRQETTYWLPSEQRILVGQIMVNAIGNGLNACFDFFLRDRRFERLVFDFNYTHNRIFTLFVQSYEKSSEMQKENEFFFAFPRRGNFPKSKINPSY